MTTERDVKTKAEAKSQNDAIADWILQIKECKQPLEIV
jgi:hypothetical protein